MDVTARRLELWNLLSSSREGLSLKAAAARFGVSKNTIQRDVDTLSRAGLPVLEEQDRQRLVYRSAEKACSFAPAALTADVAAFTTAAVEPYSQSAPGRRAISALRPEASFDGERPLVSRFPFRRILRPRGKRKREIPHEDRLYRHQRS